MTKRNIAASLGLLVTASACSGILGIDTSPVLVVCTTSDTSACSAGQTCENNKCVSTTSAASQTGGASSVESLIGGVTSFGSTSGGTSAAVTGGAMGTGGSLSGGTSATGGIVSSGGSLNGNTTTGGTESTGGAGTGGSQNGGTSAVATGGTIQFGDLNGGTSSSDTTTTGGTIGSGGTSNSTGGDAVVVGGASTGGAAGDTGGLSTAGQTAPGGQTASIGGSAGGLSSGGAASGGTSSCTGDSGTGSCVPGTHRCHVPENTEGNPVYWQTCGSDCTWNSGTYCSQYCTTSDGCQTAPSCNGLNPSLENLSCCSSTPLDGGAFTRSVTSDDYGNAYCTPDNPCPATVGPFSLDLYEVTVGRFRNFVAAYSQAMVTRASGRNQKIPTDMGWDTTWNANLPADRTALVQRLTSCSPSTYTVQASGSEYLPVNCVDWYIAYAFCAWDGGRLPTELEWDFAASGGQNRVYPWSSPPDNAFILPADAVYSPSDQIDPLPGPRNVGSVSGRTARWGQYDMAGNILELVVDAYAAVYTDSEMCTECANLSWSTSSRVARGGDYLLSETSVTGSFRTNASTDDRFAWMGFRCARDR